MLQIFVIIALVLASFYLAYKVKTHVAGPNKVKKIVYQGGVGVTALLAAVVFTSLSILYVGKNEIAQLDQIYLGDDMVPGQIIALEGQKGPKARILTPGFKFIPFVRFKYDIEYVKTVVIPPNAYGIVFAKDGSSLREGQVIADPWTDYKDMINAETFLKKGGQRGTQLTVLPPAKYQINTYLFDVKIKPALQVETGEVAVIRSNVQTAENCEDRIEVEGLSTALVEKGCVGVWKDPLYQGMHFLNEDAYVATKISTRAQVWTYKGGYKTKKIDLTVNSDGSITQTSTPITVDMPENAADKAINVRVEGWTVPVEARVTVQVAPENAPIVVAGVGTLKNVEDKITTPNIRDSLRTIGGREASGCVKGKCKVEAARVLDFVTKRDLISKRVFADIRVSTESAGVTIIDVNLGEPAIPPELLVANQREQIAEQLEKTYKAEKKTQKLRIAVEKEKATADQQKVLVKANIAEEASVKYMNKRANEGRGEQKYLTAKAKGEKARVAVLGAEKVYELEVIKIVAENHEMVKVPTTVVQGSAGLEGMAAVFGGHSNIAKAMAVAK